jgi:succinate dehydrogenase / fumarate reductase, iron-sulfur subunit
MKFRLLIWRQDGPEAPGGMVEYPMDDVLPDMSFLEMLDQLNIGLVLKGEEPIAFDHDCREGICGSCGLVINGVAHGPEAATTTCQLYMRKFRDGDTLHVEPWRARAFPVIKDLVVDRGAFDRIIQSGGFVSVNTGSAAEANSVLVGKEETDLAMDAAQCIGCGACVAACKNSSAMLFVAAKVSHLALLPQGRPERASRVQRMVATMDQEGFGNCTNQYECEAVCPKSISRRFITRLNREFLASIIKHPIDQ